VEKKLFIPKIGYREGAYGIKAHIPFGTFCNIYGFLDMKNPGSVDSLAVAGKAEFLLGNTEMAVSMWNKKNSRPVFGYDISTRQLGIDITGEISVSHGSNTYSLFEDNGALYKDKSKDWQTKASIDFGKDFDLFSISKGLNVIASFYYNRTGYSDNLFADNRLYTFRNPLQAQDTGAGSATLTQGTKTMFLLIDNLYEQHDFSRYYASIDTKINRLFLNSLTGFVNFIDNIPQSSMIVSAGINYTSLNEFFAGLTVNGFLGGRQTEYTFTNQAFLIQLTAGLTF
jgi:hypothetical protein